MDRLFIILGVTAGLALIASVGAFLYFVSPLTLATAVVVLLSITLMFALGVAIGSRRIRPDRLLRAWRIRHVSH